MLAPHRRAPNRARDIRERINALVRSRIGPGIICGKCGASYTTMAERCEADLGEACPGSNAISRVQLIAERELGVGLE